MAQQGFGRESVRGPARCRGLGLTRQAGLGCVPRTGLLARSVLLSLATTERAGLTVAPGPPLVNLFGPYLWTCSDWSPDTPTAHQTLPSEYPAPSRAPTSWRTETATT